MKYSEDTESDTESDYSDVDEEGSVSNKKKKLASSEEFVLPPGFLAPLNPPLSVAPLSQAPLPSARSAPVDSCKQFWKAGDYHVPPTTSSSLSNGLDHARVHPKFLHSNATSHKWALGAFAELLDNAVDEISHGATYVAVDVLENKKDKNTMLLVQDNGGGMNACTIRHCMSLGYSVKSKIANTIGQYGNGFKTSTMRLGADVIVFTRCRGKDGENPTQSIGMLSYTFLRSTGKDDIVVPILDYEKRGPDSWKHVIRSSIQDWNTNLNSILQWSPFSSEAELVKEFELMGEQGTRVIIYNLWDLEPGMLELDFDTDSDDIHLRGINRDEQKIEMGKKYPSTRHYVTYQHSLRSYASILYLRLPAEFRIILRGKVVEHHSLVDDMMLTVNTKYTPLTLPNQSAPITLGFVKDAKDHIDIQGFSVYHKNRLIEAFWKVWSTTSCSGRGIIGVVEANFVEPAHDKQSFETTPVLERLKWKLNAEQKKYWRNNYEKVGYVVSVQKRRRKKKGPNKENDIFPVADAMPAQEGQPAPQTQLVHAPHLSGTQPGQHVTASQTKGTVEGPATHLPEMQPVEHFTVTRTKGTTPTYEATKTELNVEKQQLHDREPRKEEVQSANICSHCMQPEKQRVDDNHDRFNMHASSSDEELLAENSRLKEKLQVYHLFCLKVKANLMEKNREIERLKNEATENGQQMQRLKYEANEKDKQNEQLKREAKAHIEVVNHERNRRDNEEAILRMHLMEAQAVIKNLQTEKNTVSMKTETY